MNDLLKVVGIDAITHDLFELFFSGSELTTLHEVLSQPDAQHKWNAALKRCEKPASLVSAIGAESVRIQSVGELICYCRGEGLNPTAENVLCVLDHMAAALASARYPEMIAALSGRAPGPSGTPIYVSETLRQNKARFAQVMRKLDQEDEMTEASKRNQNVLSDATERLRDAGFQFALEMVNQLKQVDVRRDGLSMKAFLTTYEKLDLTASTNAPLTRGSLIPLWRVDSNTALTEHQTANKLQPAVETAPDRTLEPIWSHHDGQYSVDRVSPYVVPDECDDILTAFREKKGAMTSDQLKDKSGSSNPRRALKTLADFANGVFRDRIRFPGGRSKGGYFVWVVDINEER